MIQFAPRSPLPACGAFLLLVFGLFLKLGSCKNKPSTVPPTLTPDVPTPGVFYCPLRHS